MIDGIVLIFFCAALTLCAMFGAFIGKESVGRKNLFKKMDVYKGNTPTLNKQKKTTMIIAKVD